MRTLISRFHAFLITAIVVALSQTAAQADFAKVKGFTISEIGDHLYDASLDPAFKTEAQLIVDRLYLAGVRHVNLSPRAEMTHPRNSYLVPKTPSHLLSWERERYIRLINYIHSKGMTVGMRPIFFVVDSLGNVPFIEILPGGVEKVWWHGNIQPSDPGSWFESFYSYLSIYLDIANVARVEEFTVGAELQSMTVGSGEGDAMGAAAGYPIHWLNILRRARAAVQPTTRLMYDINYTDALEKTGNTYTEGGEFAMWTYRLTTPPNGGDVIGMEQYNARLAFWRELDAVGIDMYRSLAEHGQVVPSEYTELVNFLKVKAESYALQLDNSLRSIATVVGSSKLALLKELGYRSVEYGFVDPFEWAGKGELNIEHQAAAYQAVLTTFRSDRFGWFKGVVFWDASVDLDRHGPIDIGFSPIGKELTESVMRYYFEN